MLVIERHYLFVKQLEAYEVSQANQGFADDIIKSDI